MNRLVAVGVIWVGCSVAWAMLGATLQHRTHGASSSMRAGVEGLWGPEASQVAPYAELSSVSSPTLQTPSDHRADLVSSDIDVELDLEHRQKGLLWFPTYNVELNAEYGFHNPHLEPRSAVVYFNLQSSGDSFDGFHVLDGDGNSVPYRVENGQASWITEFEPDETKTFAVGYRSRGIASWGYNLGVYPGQQKEIKSFELDISVDDDEIDFPDHTLSPSSHRHRSGAWEGSWHFDSLITDANIGVVLPSRINPGPLASRITFFAPVGLLFFFFLVAMISVVRGPWMHPMHFFFLGCSFFAFHLLFAYLVDHVAVAPAFAISTLTSAGLAVGYARAIEGPRLAWRVVGPAQLVYLVLFSASFFLEGLTGLTVAIGAVITLAVAMRLSAGHQWARPQAAMVAPAPTAPAAPAPAVAPAPAPAPAPKGAPSALVQPGPPKVF